MSVVCPVCYSKDTKVADSRAVVEPIHSIRRRRKCCECRHGWNTFEISEDLMSKTRKVWRALKAVRAFDLEEIDDDPESE